jgi:hypothetical protein
MNSNTLPTKPTQSDFNSGYNNPAIFVSASSYSVKGDGTVRVVFYDQFNAESQLNFRCHLVMPWASLEMLSRSFLDALDKARSGAKPIGKEMRN